MDLAITTCIFNNIPATIANYIFFIEIPALFRAFPCRPFVFNNILALFGEKRILPKLALGVKSRGSGHLDWVYPPKAEIAPRHCQALFHSKRQLVPLPLSSKKYASILAYAQALVKHKNPLVLS